MSVTEKSGSVVLLRQPDPPLLLGGCCCLLSGPDQGWTGGSFYPDENGFRLVLGQERVVLEMSFDVALNLAGILTVTSLQGLPLDVGASVGNEVVECRYIESRRDRPVSLAILAGPDLIKHHQLDDQVELRLRPLVAKASADSIFQLAARTFG